MASQEHLIKMQAGASCLDEIFNGDAKGPDKKIGFILITFPLEGEDRRASLVFNSEDIKPQIEPILETLAHHISLHGVETISAKYDS